MIHGCNYHNIHLRYQNILFLLIAFVTLWGTVFPIFSQAVDETTMTVGKPFFDKVNGPLMLLLILLMGIAPQLPWRKVSWVSFRRMLRVPVSVAFLVCLLLLTLGIRQPWVLISISLFSTALSGIFQEWVRGSRSLHRDRVGERRPHAVVRDHRRADLWSLRLRLDHALRGA